MTPRPASGDTRTKEHREAKQIESQKSKFLERLRSQLDRKLNSYRKKETNKKLSTPGHQITTPVPFCYDRIFLRRKIKPRNPNGRERINQYHHQPRNSQCNVKFDRQPAYLTYFPDTRSGHHYRMKETKKGTRSSDHLRHIGLLWPFARQWLNFLSLIISPAAVIVEASPELELRAQASPRKSEQQYLCTPSQVTRSHAHIAKAISATESAAHELNRERLESLQSKHNALAEKHAALQAEMAQVKINHSNELATKERMQQLPKMRGCSAGNAQASS